MLEQTLSGLNQLKLFGMASALEAQLAGTGFADLAFEQRVALLVDTEISFRDNRRLQRLLRNAKLKYPSACVEDILFRSGRGLEKSTLASFALCNWIRAAKNLAITGKTGTGKTWLACALGNQACRFGFTVSFQRVPLLVERLAVSHGDGSYLQLLEKIAKPDLVILDDLGISPLSAVGRSDLLEAIESRNGCKATLITSQLPVKSWHTYLAGENGTVADAILDRLTGGADRLELRGPSLRDATDRAEKEAKE